MAKIFRPLSENVLERVQSDLVDYTGRGRDAHIVVTTYKAGRTSEERMCTARVPSPSLAVDISHTLSSLSDDRRRFLFSRSKIPREAHHQCNSGRDDANIFSTGCFAIETTKQDSS